MKKQLVFLFSFFSSIHLFGMDMTPSDFWNQLKGLKITDLGSSRKDIKKLFSHPRTLFLIQDLLNNEKIDPNQACLSIGKRAAYTNTMSVLEIILKTNKMNEQCKTDLFYHVAYIRPNKDAVILLLNYDANPNMPYSFSKNIALNVLIEYHDPQQCNKQLLRQEILYLLIQNPKVDINLQTTAGLTPLHLAIQNIEKTDIAKLLLDQPSIDINISHPRHGTPLEYATKCNKTAYIQLLTQKAHALQTTSQYPNSPHLEFWKQVNMSITDGSQSWSAAKALLNQPNASLHITSLLKNNIIDPNKVYDRSSLSLGEVFLETNSLPLLEIILNSGKVSPQEKTNLFYRATIKAMTSNTHAMDLLLKYEADPNAPRSKWDREVVLHRIVTDYSLMPLKALEQMFCWLITKPQININAQNNSGDTPLHIAIWHDNMPFAQLLLSHPLIDTTITNKANQTPLCLAKSIRKNQFLTLLTQKKAADAHP